MRGRDVDERHGVEQEGQTRPCMQRRHGDPSSFCHVKCLLDQMVILTHSVMCAKCLFDQMVAMLFNYRFHYTDFCSISFIITIIVFIINTHMINVTIDVAVNIITVLVLSSQLYQYKPSRAMPVAATLVTSTNSSYHENHLFQCP